MIIISKFLFNFSNFCIIICSFNKTTNIKYFISTTVNAVFVADIILTPVLSYYGTKTRVKFTGSCLKQSSSSYNHRPIVNIYIVYKLGASGSNNNDPAIKICLFGAVTLTKNADIDKHGYFGYGTGFDGRGSFSFPGGGFSQNVS